MRYCRGRLVRSVLILWDFWPLLADWFSEQFSTGVLIVPCNADVGNSWSAAAL